MGHRPPNVVLVFMDDQTHDTIAALGHTEVTTPNLDRLVSSGTAFTHAFNQGSWVPAVCVAARAMLITGQGLFTARRAVDDSRLLGEHMTAAGYHTFFTGKWHNGEPSLRRSYTEVGPWFGGIHPGPFDLDDEEYNRPAERNRWSPSDETRGRHWMDVGDGRVTHSSVRWADAAVEFLERDDIPDPWFLHIAFHAPHDPRQSPQEYLDMYPLDEVQVPPNFAAEHPFDQGDHFIRDEMLAPFPRTPEAVRLHRQEYFAIITHADRQIGRILDQVEERGLADDTIIVFSGDHGLAVGEHGLMGKQNQYDHSVRVPLVLAGPGVPTGRVVDSLVYQNSIYPTICHLAGVPIPDDVDAPYLPRLSSEAPTEDASHVFGAYRHLQRMVRSRTHKLIAYPEAGRHQLFDLETDPWETHDLSTRSDQSALMASLRRELETWQASVGDDLDVSTAFPGA